MIRWRTRRSVSFSWRNSSMRATTMGAAHSVCKSLHRSLTTKWMKLHALTSPRLTLMLQTAC